MKYNMKGSLTLAMISIICFQASIVIADLLNKFIINSNYFEAKINNILSIIYKNELKS